MTRLTLTVFDPIQGGPVEAPLPMTSPGSHARVSLRRIAGGTGVHLHFTEDHPDGPRVHRMEIPGGYDADMTVVVSWPEHGRVLVRSAGRDTFFLPAESAYGPEATDWMGGPVPPIVPPALADALDVAILVDATTRRWFHDANQGDTSELLLGNKEEWIIVVDRLLDLAAGLAAGRSRVRVAVLAFADEPHTTDTPDDLRPRFLLYPFNVAERQLAERDPPTILRLLSQLPQSTGGDYVDALGEGLRAACELHWSDTARRLLILFGDSPGYSLEAPAPWGADARVRTVDVDTEAARLHRRGVELATIYAGPPEELGLYDPGRATSNLLRFTREQYRRLASTPRHSFELEGFDADHAAQVLGGVEGPLARGPTWPCFVEAVAITPAAARALR